LKPSNTVRSPLFRKRLIGRDLRSSECRSDSLAGPITSGRRVGQAYSRRPIYEQAVSSRLLQILRGGFRALPRRHQPRSVESPLPADSARLVCRSAALPLSRMLREGDSPSQHPGIFERPWPTRLKTRPTIYSGSSLSDVPMKKITENAALHPNEDPQAVIPGHCRSRSPNRVWSSSRLDACSCFPVLLSVRGELCLPTV
jgi:hypothetical protein